MYKSLSKAISLVFLYNIMIVESATAPNCLQCKLRDSNSPIGPSFSYCSATDYCLKDQWLYIN